MHHLVMPFAQTRLHIDRHERVAEQIVARTMSAVFIHQRHADRDVDQAQIGIGGVGRPRVVLAHAFGADLRAALPRIGAELAGLRHEIELPQLAPRAHVKAANEARNVVRANRVVAVDRRVTDDDHTVHHDRRRTGRDLPVGGVDADGTIRPNSLRGIPRFAGLRFARRCRIGDDQRTGVVHGQRHHRKTEAFHQIDDAIAAEVCVRHAGLGVQRDHVIAGRDDDHALVFSVGPVGRATSCELSRRLLPANAFVEPVHPQRFSGLGIDRHHRAARGRDGEQSPVRIQRRGAIVLIRSECAGVPLPRHLQ